MHVEVTHEHEPNFILNYSVQNCTRMFKIVRSFKWHTKKYHRTTTATVSPLIRKCPHCEFHAESYAKLLVHFRIHLKYRQKVKCPVNGCNKYYSVYSSLT